MNIFQNQIFTVLTVPPGNLVYHLVIAFSMAGALFGAVNLWRSSQFPQARRAVIGLGVLLGLQVILFILSSLTWQGFLVPENILPPIDRAVTLISLAWVTWLWAFPEPLRAADAATLLLNVLALAFFGLTLVAWPQNNPAAFLDHYSLDFIWQIFSLVYVLLGIIILAIRQPNGWNYGLAMLLLAFAGHMLALFIPSTSDFVGVVRLSQLAMYPILLTLSQRFPVAEGTMTSVPEKSKKAEKATKEKLTFPMQGMEKRRNSTDPKTFHALLTLAAETDPDKIGSALTRSIAQATLADLCFLVTANGEKNITIAYGYDLIREESIGGTALSNEAAPMLATAVQRGRPLRLPASTTSADLKGVGQALGLGSAGHLLCVPVVSPEKGALGSILLLSPYSNRLWNADDQAFLTNVSSLFVPILDRARTIAVMKHERDQARHDAQMAKEDANIAQKKANDASQQFEAVREKASQMQLQADNMAALVAMQEESQKLIEQLKGENLRLRQSSDSGGITAIQIEQAERELRLALKENAHLQNAMAEANIKILELEKRQSTTGIGGEQAEVVASISQELRQPMSSIVGYTDLLLGESVGILGALQRKFIERIKASTERIGGLVDDLIQVTNMEANPVEIKPEAVDLNLIIDNAVAYTSTQIREKNITLRLDTSGIPPQVQTDREALQQILIHLLQNAGSASPTDGTVGLHIHIQNQELKDYLQIEVSDTGGGIAPEDIEHVFQRRYRADHPLIQGLGDTSVGLSIAKALVDAQKGRIWVDSKPTIGSTFSVLLPINRNIVEEK